MRLTNNFSTKEFDSKDGAKMPHSVYVNVVKLATQLQILRDYLGKPIKINSGYRSPRHNRKIGGVATSQHIKGKASDIVIQGLSPKEVYSTIEYLIGVGKMKQGGLGLYNSFVHYDIRGKKARWNYKK